MQRTNNMPTQIQFDKSNKNDFTNMQMCWLNNKNIRLRYIFICVQSWQICILSLSMIVLVNTVISNTTFSRYVFEKVQSAKCKMSAQTGRTYYVFVKICHWHCSDHLFMLVSNWYILQELCFLCVHYLSNICNVYIQYIQLFLLLDHILQA